MNPALIQEPSSYRDPSGFIFSKNAVIYRQVNKNFAEHFDHFISSGCYDDLVRKGWLIPHETVNENFTGSQNWHTTLKPQVIPFISFPYEWSFGMLREAALLTLNIVKECIDHDLILKDASAYNIQWHQGKMIFIDTLSFEKYDESLPWIAYRQFCEQFLAPLLLMHYRKMPLSEMMLAWPEGIPLQICSGLLPSRTRFSLPVYLHIHLHSKISGKASSSGKKIAAFSRKKMLNIVGSLEQLIRRLRFPERKSTWSEYYDEVQGRHEYLENKKAIIQEWLPHFFDVQTAFDLGANEGAFSKILATQKIYTIAADADPYCIEKLYHSLSDSEEKNIQPLIIDLSHPSPSIGVNNQERKAFTERAKGGLVLALALIHHLVIGKNIPFDKIAALFADISRKWLVIEFVPKTDDKIVQMLSSKKDIYENYSPEIFEAIFRDHFDIRDKKTIGDSGRTLYLLKKHGD